MVMPANHPIPGRIYIALGPWYFVDYHNIFLQNLGENPKQVLPSERGAPVIVPYGKSGPYDCITFITRLDEGLR